MGSVTFHSADMMARERARELAEAEYLAKFRVRHLEEVQFFERQVLEKVRARIAEQRKRYIPDEKATQSLGQLGFDYGYQQALAEMDSGLYVIEFAKPEPSDVSVTLPST